MVMHRNAMEFPYPKSEQSKTSTSVRGDVEEVEKPVSWSAQTTASIEEHIKPLLRSVDGAPVLGGVLPSIKELAEYFGDAAPMPSLHGLKEHQAKAALLQLCGCSDTTIAGILGFTQKQVSSWVRKPGWRSFQREVLDHSLTRLVGMAHLALVQQFLYTDKASERVKLAKWIIDTSGVHSAPTKHVHHHEHSVSRATERDMSAAKAIGTADPLVTEDGDVEGW